MDLEILARDASGVYRIAKYPNRTAVGHVVQVLDPGSATGLHRTWHNDGRVHDRTNNPPSTSSAGELTPPDEAKDELWGRYDLEAGELAECGYARADYALGKGAVLIDLMGSAPRQRVEVWITQTNRTEDLLKQLRLSAGALLVERAD